MKFYHYFYQHNIIILSLKLCKLVISAAEVIKNKTFTWPLTLIVNETDTFPINDFDYLKARVRNKIYTQKHLTQMEQ
jgi:hypothetical protein